MNEDVVHKTATLKDFKNPIYSAPGPDSTQKLYDGVYSETGTSNVDDTVYQNANGSAPRGVTNIGGGGGDSVGDVPLYSALEPQGSSTPEQEQIPQFKNGYLHL